MAAAIGWYGPLIDLSRASSHVGDFVQLIVFVHGSQKIEKDFAFSRRPISKTDIQVGDDTRPYFLVSVWHKHIETMLVPGDIILLQNVKIVKFRDVLEAATLQITLLIVLGHGSDLISSKDSYQLIAPVQLGRMAKEKYSRVLYWIQHTESAMLVVQKKLGRQVHVGDHTGIIPLLVKNSAATILFGKITAEHVHKCCRKASQPEGGKVKPNLYHIWLILLNVLLQKQESPFQFEVNVDMEKIIENGRFELIFPRMPCYIK